jgi:fused signal recognition particle receptor
MSLFKRLFTALKSGSVTSDEWEQIRSNLISSDLGVKLVDQLIDQAKSIKPDDAKEAITRQVSSWLSQKNRNLIMAPDRVTTILVIGVNGTGKTTSVAKLANKLKGSIIIFTTLFVVHATSLLYEKLGTLTFSHRPPASSLRTTWRK